MSEAQRQLAYPDELMVLKGHQQIIFVENLDPIPGQKILWYENAALKKLGLNLHTKFAKAIKAGRTGDDAWSYTEQLPEPAPQQTISYDQEALEITRCQYTDRSGRGCKVDTHDGRQGQTPCSRDLSPRRGLN